MTAATGPAPGTTCAPAVLPQWVWVLEIEEKYGSSFTAHGDQAAALAEAAEHARDYWADVAPSHPEMPPTPDGLDDAEAVRVYFANCGREHCYIHELEI